MTTKTQDEIKQAKTAQAEQSQLEEALNQPQIVKAFGRNYEISRFTMGPLIRALPYLAPLGYVLRSAAQADATEAIVTALHVSGEPALGLISVATSEPIEWFEDKDPIDGLELLTVIVEKNADYFFEPANVERVKAAFARLQSTIQRHGGAISTTSSSTDTGP